MSQKSDDRLETEAQQLEEKAYKTGRITACSRLRIFHARHLLEIYKTGLITRPSLPTHSGPLRLTKIPDDILGVLLVSRPDTAKKTFLEIPGDVLWPKRKRGRPRNETLAALAKSQRCSERQARRLLASSKQRKRVRETPIPDEKWALQQREKRAQLVQALKHENDLNRIACTLENLNPDWAGALFEVNIRVRELAEQMVAKAGTATVLLKCSFALQSIGLRFALNALGCSRSTIYRKFSGRLDSLRTDGEILRAYDLSQVDTQIGSKPRRPSAEETENAWSVQTTSSPENFRAVSH
jgi:hypothetical protein